MAMLEKKAGPKDPESDDNESSDIAESTEGSEGGSSEDSSDESDDGSEVEDLDDASSEATEYDSSDVWSEEEDEADKETKEAAEAAIMIKFQRSLNLILDEKREKAKKILKKILKQPSVAKHKSVEFLWENDATDNSHLNKMGRVFVGAHKNLAIIDEENAIEHYLQVVGVAPSNDEVWFDLGQKLVHTGDLEMAIYAFEQSSDWRTEESLMSVHFLKKNYITSLQYVAAREERLGCFNKGNFLKKRIAAISPELNEYVRQLFGTTSFEIDWKYEKEASSRLSILQSKIVELMDESREEEKKSEERRCMDPITISLSADQSAWDIMIVFCDLFDRIQAYSEVLSQRIFIEEWECRDDKLAVENAVEGLVDDVVAIDCIVNHLVNEVSTGEGAQNKPTAARGRSKKETETKTKWRRGQRDGGKGNEGMRGAESSCDEDERPTSVDSVSLREPTALEDVDTYYLDARPIRPLREGMSQNPSRMTATPGAIGSEEDLLNLMREALYEERFLTVFKALEYCLYSTLTMDCLPSRSSHQSEILMQVYRRWTICSSDLLSPPQLSIHAFMVMYDEPTAMDYCVQVYQSSLVQTDDSKLLRFPEKRDLIRFVYKRVEQMSDNAEECMKWLKFMTESIEEEEAFNVVGGIVSRDSISEILEKKERAGRIRSLKHLSATKKWDEIVSIVESDAQWSSVEDDVELTVRTKLYTRALVHLKREEKAGEIINRMLFLLLSQPSLPVTTITPWIRLLNAIDYSAIPSDSKMLPSLGYSLLRLTEHSHLARDWKLWRVLHQVIKRIEQSRSNLLGDLFNESLDDDYNRTGDYDELPLRSLRFLVHAHDRMATMKVCGQQNGAFLAYSLCEFRLVMERSDVRELLRWRKLQWLTKNVTEEVNQLLHCAFGRYGKRKRAHEDHESGIELGERDRKVVEAAIALSIPNPIPHFDDKGTGGVDLMDLVTNRFPSFIRMNERRQGRVNELKRWIDRGPVWKGELKEGETREQKMRSLLLSWPHEGVDSQLESTVFYLFALHYHRQSKHEEARQYAEYFLSSNHVRTFGEEVTIGAWVMLSYGTTERMFKLYDDDLVQEVDQHLRPLRVAMELSKETDATVPFMLALSLYQTATRLARYFRRKSASSLDPHERYSIVDDLRSEATALFEKVIEVTPVSQDSDQSTWDEQWMAHFFLAKLHLKGDNPDVGKAVDYFFEAAAALQVGGVVYLQKIAAKNQKHLEPVEVHYQMYSTVWKYITRTDNPSFDVLVRLRSYTDALSKHGVVKPSAAMDLYQIAPAISEVTRRMTFTCGRREDESDEQYIMNTTLDKVELIEELKTACKEAFKVVVDRFPHRKAFHRLAEIAVRDGDMFSAHAFIFKKIFPRKKNESIFGGVVEFTSSDLERSCSLSFHVTRSLRLGLAVAVRMGEAASIVAVCTSLAKTITDEEESFVFKSSYVCMIRLATRALSLVLSTHHAQWNKAVKTETLALVKSLTHVKGNLALTCLRGEMNKIVDKHGGLARLETEVATMERRPAQQRKRKLAADDRSTADKILGGLGLVGRPPPPKKEKTAVSRPPITLLRPPTTTQTTRPVTQSTQRPSTQSAQQAAALAAFTRALQSPIRGSSSTSLASPNNSPPIDPNRLLQILLQAQSQSSSNASNPFANLFPKK